MATWVTTQEATMRERLRDWLGLNVALSAVAMRLTDMHRQLETLRSDVDALIERQGNNDNQF